MGNNYDLYELFTLVIIVSFLGFCLENLSIALRRGYIDNRGMNLPFLLGYGLAVLGFYTVIGTPKAPKIGILQDVSPAAAIFGYFVLYTAAVSIGEMALGSFVEHKFGFEYWNYESIPFHITKYTSLPTSVGFGLAITVFMNHCIDPMMSFVHTLPDPLIGTVSVALMILLSADFISSFHYMYKNHGLNIKWTKKVELSFRRRKI